MIAFRVVSIAASVLLCNILLAAQAIPSTTRRHRRQVINLVVDDGNHAAPVVYPDDIIMWQQRDGTPYTPSMMFEGQGPCKAMAGDGKCDIKKDAVGAYSYHCNDCDDPVIVVRSRTGRLREQIEADIIQELNELEELHAMLEADTKAYFSLVNDHVGEHKTNFTSAQPVLASTAAQEGRADPLTFQIRLQCQDGHEGVKIVGASAPRKGPFPVSWRNGGGLLDTDWAINNVDIAPASTCKGKMFKATNGQAGGCEYSSENSFITNASFNIEVTDAPASHEYCKGVWKCTSDLSNLPSACLKQ